MIPVIAKRTITIDNHKTSVTLEDEFWSGLREVARLKNATLRSLVTQIDDARGRNNLSSAIRVFVLNYYRAHAHLVDNLEYKATSDSNEPRCLERCKPGRQDQMFSDSLQRSSTNQF
jgi:predicted DNA-binding ribbon-helix-helix protein